jgi:hypothetical protein
VLAIFWCQSLSSVSTFLVPECLWCQHSGVRIALPPLSIAESSGQTLALTTVSASSLPDLSEGSPVMVNISNFTTVKILDERPSPSGVKYRCELEPLWSATDSVEKVKMGRVRIRSYKNGLIWANRLGTLRERKRKHS